MNSLPPTAPGALPAPNTGTFAGHTGRGAGVVSTLTYLDKGFDKGCFNFTEINVNSLAF